MNSPRGRYTDLDLPPYSYVPGHSPHPVSNPAGHMHGTEHETPLPLVPESWQESPEYLYGIDLFNHGYYWEAHEAWEALWLAAGRHGSVADFLKGLIKLAAAGVKAREGNPRGVQRHGLRAIELLCGVHAQLGDVHDYCGVDLRGLIQAASALARDAAPRFAESEPHLLLDVWLALNDAQSKGFEQ